MTVGRLTKKSVEVLLGVDATGRATKKAVEILLGVDATGRATKTSIEVLYSVLSDPIAEGGALSGGTADVFLVLNLENSGGAVANGEANVTIGSLGLGGALVGGISEVRSPNSTFIIAPSGTVASGVALVETFSPDDPGKVLLGGKSQVFLDSSDSGLGGLSAGGNATTEIIENISGKVVLGGRANAITTVVEKPSGGVVTVGVASVIKVPFLARPPYSRADYTANNLAKSMESFHSFLHGNINGGRPFGLCNMTFVYDTILGDKVEPHTRIVVRKHPACDQPLTLKDIKIL